MDEQVKELVEAVLEWWYDHMYDVTGDYGEYNVYYDTPDFVVYAQNLAKHYGIKEK